MSKAAGTIALVVVSLGFALIQLDATIVNVALPAIHADIGGSLSALQWILNGYTLALAAFLLAAGWCADMFGGRRVFLVGLAVFCAGSAVCAVAPDVGILVAARVVQGLGAAALLPSSLALLVHQFPDASARAKALGVWGGVGSVGLAAGPVLGGVVVAYVNWRLIFLVNIPVGIGTAIMLRAVAESPRRARESLDIGGLLLGGGALSGLVAYFIAAGRLGWADPLSLGLLVAGIACAGGFIRRECSTAAPMVPLSLFGSVRFSAAVTVGLLFNFCLYGALLCLSLFLQQGKGFSVLHAGLLLLPLTVVIGFGASSSGPLTARFGSRPPMVAGLLLAACGVGLLAVVRSPGGIVLGSMLLALCSLAMPAMTAAAVGAVEPRRAGLASGILNAARQSGGAFGVAVLGSLIGRLATPHLLAPMLVAVAGYLVAATVTWCGIGPDRAARGEPDRAAEPAH